MKFGNFTDLQNGVKHVRTLFSSFSAVKSNQFSEPQVKKDLYERTITVSITH